MRLVAFMAIVAGASCLTLNIEPKKSHSRPGSNVSIMCTADGPLSACQWKKQWSQGSSVIDLSLGAASQPNTSCLDDVVGGCWYYGTGLQNGDCGITLSFRSWGNRIIGCRVRTETGGWVYEENYVQIDDLTPFSLIPASREVVVLPGESVNLMCQAPVPLSDCTFSYRGWGITRFNHGAASEESIWAKYFGSGLEQGQCGATLRNFTADISGNILCSGRTMNIREYEIAYMSVILAEQPERISLELVSSRVTEGDTLKVSCIVSESRPVANITWYLGGQVIRHDAVDDSPVDSRWVWKNMPSAIMQVVVRTVTREDDGKVLMCAADHVALSKPMNVSTTLNVTALSLNKTGVTNINPLPDLDLPRKVCFYLYTRSQNNPPIRMEIKNMSLDFPFNPELQTKILIHGYRNELNSPMIQRLQKAYLAEGDYNVIAVDWGDLAFAPRSMRVRREDIGVTLRGQNYPRAKNNTYHVGGYIGQFIDYLVEQGVDLEKVHLIGHSLGAHTAGVAGASLTRGKVARITGLDPSGIYFATDPHSTRLDKSDAFFVDVLHTNYRDGLGGSASLGFKDTCGHADFYVNGGAYQPACCSEGQCDAVCSHRMAWQYFEMLIKDRTTFPAYKCANLDHVFFNAWGCAGYPKCNKSSNGYFMGDDNLEHGIYYVYVNNVTSQCCS